MKRAPASIDPQTFTITFQRLIPASREDVFDAWTKPDEIAEWWDPTGTRLTTCRIDLRVGGAFHFEHAGHGPAFAGVYRVVDRPGKLVFDALGSVGTVTLRAEGKLTHLLVEIRCASAEHLQQFVKLSVHTGTEQTLDNLVERFSRK